MSWYRNGELHRLEQPVSKQYSFGKDPEYTSELEQVKAVNRFPKQHLRLQKRIKKVQGIGEEVSPESVVAWIESIRGEVLIKQACEWLEIARASYYCWKAAIVTKCEELLTEGFVNFAPPSIPL